MPSVDDEAARHVSRERTALTKEQTRLSNQITGLAGDVGLRRVGACATGGRVVDHGARLARRAPCPRPSKPGSPARTTRLRLVATQIAALEQQQQATVQRGRPRHGVAAGSCNSRASRRRAPRSSSTKGWCGARSAIGARSAGCSGLRPRRMTVGTPSTTRASVAQATRTCRRSVFSWHGIGCAGNRPARSRRGIARASARDARAADWDCGGRPQTAYCVVALRHDGRRPHGGDPEERISAQGAARSRGLMSTRLTRAALTVRVGSRTMTVAERYCRSRVRGET